jgi:hypothetical protein
MSAPDDDEPISVEETRLIIGNGQLGVMAQRLARHRRFASLASLLEHLTGLPIPLRAATDAMRIALRALRDVPERRRERPSSAASEALRTIRLLAGEALTERVSLPALTEVERTALDVAGTAFFEAGDLVRAARTFQGAADWAAAADAWGRLGDLDAMESCLARDEEERRRLRSAAGTIRDIEALMLAGARREALGLAETVPAGTDDAAAARRIAQDVAARLIRGRGLTLRARSGHLQEPTRIRLSGTPARLGRDGAGEIVLRDPGVSRQHARLDAVEGGGLELVDAGARLGVFVAGARLERSFTLTGDCEIALGPTCALGVRLIGAGCVELRGLSGLDRGLRAVVGSGPIALGAFLPGAEGISVELAATGAHLRHGAGSTVRLDGHRAAREVDLLHGDVLDIERRAEPDDLRAGAPTPKTTTPGGMQRFEPEPVLHLEIE